jgi:hypothetical protein
MKLERGDYIDVFLNGHICNGSPMKVISLPKKTNKYVVNAIDFYSNRRIIDLKIYDIRKNIKAIICNMAGVLLKKPLKKSGISAKENILTNFSHF